MGFWRKTFVCEEWCWSHPHQLQSGSSLSQHQVSLCPPTSPLHLSEFRKLTALFPDFSKLVFFFFLAGFNISVVALLAFLVPPLLWTGALLFPVLSAMLTDCLSLFSKVAVVSTSPSPSSREKSPLSRPLSLVKDVSLSAKNRNKTSYNFIPFYPCTKIRDSLSIVALLMLCKDDLSIKTYIQA